MSLDERIISKAILERYFEKFKSCLDLDVAVVGGGPSGMLAARDLAAKGFKVALFERKLSLGGGLWGGGMTFNVIVVQEEGRRLLESVGIRPEPYAPGYYTACAVAATMALGNAACAAGARIFNCISVEDVVLRGEGQDKRVAGLVVNATAVETAGLHVDPLVVRARVVIEATGHAVEVLKTLVRKNGVTLLTASGGIEGEQSLWAEVAERDTMTNTREIFPGLWVAGMAANASFGSYRMGPVFGGMLLSGEKAARDIAARLKQPA